MRHGVRVRVGHLVGVRVRVRAHPLPLTPHLPLPRAPTCGAMPASSAHAPPPGCWPIAYSMAAAYLVRLRVRVRDTVRVRTGVRVRVGVARWPRRTPSAKEYA